MYRRSLSSLKGKSYGEIPTEELSDMDNNISSNYDNRHVYSAASTSNLNQVSPISKELTTTSPSRHGLNVSPKGSGGMNERGEPEETGLTSFNNMYTYGETTRRRGGSHVAAATFRDRATIVFCDLVSSSSDESDEREFIDDTDDRDRSYNFDCVSHGYASAEEGALDTCTVTLNKLEERKAEEKSKPSFHHKSEPLDLNCQWQCKRRKRRTLLRTEIIIATRPTREELWSSCEGDEGKRWEPFVLPDTLGERKLVPEILSSVALFSQPLLFVRVTEIKKERGRHHDRPPLKATVPTRTAANTKVMTKTLFEASSIPLRGSNYSLLDTSVLSGNSIGLGSLSMGLDATVDNYSSNDHPQQRRVASPQYAIIEECVRQLGPFLFIPPENNHTIGAGGNIHNYLPQGACSCFVNNCCARSSPPRCGRPRGVTINNTEAHRTFSDDDHSSFGEFQGCSRTRQWIHSDRLEVRRQTRKGNARVFSSESILGRVDDAGSIHFAPDGSDSDTDICESENNTFCKNRRDIHARREGIHRRQHQYNKKWIFPYHSCFVADSREPFGVHVCEGSRNIINAIVDQALRTR